MIHLFRAVPWRAWIEIRFRISCLRLCRVVGASWYLSRRGCRLPRPSVDSKLCYWSFFVTLSLLFLLLHRSYLVFPFSFYHLLCNRCNSWEFCDSQRARVDERASKTGGKPCWVLRGSPVSHGCTGYPNYELGVVRLRPTQRGRH